MAKMSSVLLILFLIGCGGDHGPTPFVLNVESVDVVRLAVHRMDVLLRPSMLNQRFQMAPDAVLGGGVSTRVTGAGEYLIQFERGWVTANARIGPTTFNLDIPLLGAGGPDDPAIGNPTARVSFHRLELEVGRGEAPLPWPLPPGNDPLGRATVSVHCDPDYRWQCNASEPPDAGDPDGRTPDAPVDATPDATDATEDGLPVDAEADGSADAVTDAPVDEPIDVAIADAVADDG